MMENNYCYSCCLLESSLEFGVLFFYVLLVVVYGVGWIFCEVC